MSKLSSGSRQSVRNAAGIWTMPPEITQQILRDACLEKKDLLAISSSCKFLQEMVEPFLYSSIPPLQPVLDRVKGLDEVDDSTTIPLLLRTLLDKPQLGQHFKNVTFHDEFYFGGTEYEQYDFQHPPQNTLLLTKSHWEKIEFILNEIFSTTEALASCETLINSSQTTEGIVKKWLQLMTGYNPNFRFFASLVLLLLPKVEKLCITMYNDPDLSIYPVLATISKIQRRAPSVANGLYSLPKLRELFLEGNESADLDPKNVFQIFQLQSLRTLTFNHLCIIDTTSHDLSVSLTLHHLTLLKCCLPLPALCKVLLNCPHLKLFKLSYYPNHENSPLVSFTKVVDSLQHLEGHLEHLTYMHHPLEHWPKTGVFPSLTRFRKLRCLQLNGDTLLLQGSSAYSSLNFSHLPSSLEKIFIVYPLQSQNQMIALLTTNLSALASTPKLKGFHIDLDPGRAEDGTRFRVPLGGYFTPPESKQRLVALSEMYAERGVRLSIAFRKHDGMSSADFTDRREVYVCSIEGENRLWKKTWISLE